MIGTRLIELAGEWVRNSGNFVDGASLAVFRMCYGVILALESVTLFMPSNSSSGMVPLDVYYRLPEGAFHFPYPGFEWIPLLPTVWINILAISMGLAGLTMAAGLFYRISAVIGFVCWMYFYLVESTRTYWMSHYYLMSIIGLMMCLLPAARRWSLDGRIFKWSHGRDGLVPLWSVSILRIQLVITYFYAGLAKVNADWLLDFQPVGYFLSQPHISEFPHVVSSVLSTKAAAGFLSWAGALFDLSIGFVLLVSRWRKTGMIFMVAFHTMNHFLLFRDIGWFPLLGVLTAFIFFSPDWPVKVLKWSGISLPQPEEPRLKTDMAPGKMNAWVSTLLGLWVLIQIALPLRHLVIPGDARFTFEGLAFSWRLKAEVYRSAPVDLRILDKNLVHQSAENRFAMHWDKSKAEPVIYRQLRNEDIQWENLPALMIVDEPLTGQRIVYNPSVLARETGQSTLRQSLKIIYEFWDKHYDRRPDKVELSISTGQLIEGWRNALNIKANGTSGSDSQILSDILGRHGPIGDRKLMPLISRLHPFQLEGFRPPDEPLVIITDNALISSGSDMMAKINTHLWHPGSLTVSDFDSRYDHRGGNPAIVYFVEIPVPGINGNRIPATAVTDQPDNPALPPMIRWHYLGELNTSKAMHMSTQPFLLRQYAVHLADRWEAMNGNRPAVYAETKVSMNGRPWQRIVYPEINLAETPLHVMSHHEWIYDLSMKRIPESGRLQGFEFK